MTELNPEEFLSHLRDLARAYGIRPYKDANGLLHLQAGKKLNIPILKEVGGFIVLDTPGSTEGMIADGLNTVIEGNSPTPPPLGN